MDFGRAGSGPGSGRCSDGPASCLRSSCWKTNRSSVSRFSTLPLKSTSIRRTFGGDTASAFFMHWSKSRALVTTFANEPHKIKELPGDIVPLRALCLCPDPPFLRCCCARHCFLQPPVPVRHLGLKTVIVFEEPDDPGPELLHLPGLGERPDRWDDPVRSHPQLGADLLQRLLHGFVLNLGLPDALRHADEGFLHPFLSFLRSRPLQLGIRSTGTLLSPWLWFRWNRT